MAPASATTATPASPPTSAIVAPPPVWATVRRPGVAARSTGDALVDPLVEALADAAAGPEPAAPGSAGALADRFALGVGLMLELTPFTTIFAELLLVLGSEHCGSLHVMPKRPGAVTALVSRSTR